MIFDYLQGRCNPTRFTELLIVPFDFNQSQIEAIETALKNKISVIEGPPGTGKTQTILNLIANILYCGKNCAVVSNKNTAINNINEKLNEENLSFIAASLGSKKNVTSFFETDQNGELANFLQQEEKPIKTNDISSRINELKGQMKTIQDLEVETSNLETQLYELINEKKHHDNIFKDKPCIKQTLSSKDYLFFITRLERSKKLRFFEYDFITNEQLLNVAISRGRNKVTAIVSDKVYYSTNNAIHDFIRYAEYLYGSETVKESKITSVFDVLYTEYKTTLLYFSKHPDFYKTELLMQNVIDQVLDHHSFIGYSIHTRLSKLVNIPA